mmetsp:Transcript_2310/g.8860  ORF Transcript_2310/g.8860 Transcript_2310/m.8860 type:complete len:264 (-) Transcript_2310:283-1074(-)
MASPLQFRVFGGLRCCLFFRRSSRRCRRPSGPRNRTVSRRGLRRRRAPSRRDGSLLRLFRLLRDERRQAVFAERRADRELAHGFARETVPVSREQSEHRVGARDLDERATRVLWVVRRRRRSSRRRETDAGPGGVRDNAGEVFARERSAEASNVRRRARLGLAAPRLQARAAALAPRRLLLLLWRRHGSRSLWPPLGGGVLGSQELRSRLGEGPLGLELRWRRVVRRSGERVDRAQVGLVELVAAVVVVPRLRRRRAELFFLR